jgi:hypothetical protein
MTAPVIHVRPTRTLALREAPPAGSTVDEELEHVLEGLGDAVTHTQRACCRAVLEALSRVDAVSRDVDTPDDQLEVPTEFAVFVRVVANMVWTTALELFNPEGEAQDALEWRERIESDLALVRAEAEDIKEALHLTESAYERMRTRCPVMADDVKAAGVDIRRARAWLASHGHHEPDWLTVATSTLAQLTNILARELGRPAFSILDEMAAQETTP